MARHYRLGRLPLWRGLNSLVAWSANTDKLRNLVVVGGGVGPPVQTGTTSLVSESGSGASESGSGASEEGSDASEEGLGASEEGSGASEEGLGSV